MTSPESANSFRRALLRWYRKNGRDLPWRRTRDPYAILVSEFMLQQTQVATVVPYYIEWLRRFPDFATLAAAPESDVLHAWQGLGYYNRARNLQATARLVVAEHAGRFPRSPAESAKLPGLGRYTANAVATFAFDDPVPIIEANIARVMARLHNIRISIDSTAGRDAIWSAATALLPRDRACEYNSALMDLGATVCTARAPKCPECPVRNFCHATEPETLPVKRPRAITRKLTEHHGFAVSAGKILLEQSSARWRGMWILPRVAAPVAGTPVLHRAAFPFTHHEITLVVVASLPEPRPQSHRWFTIEELAAIPMPSPHRRALSALLAANPARQARRSVSRRRRRRSPPNRFINAALHLLNALPRA